MIDSFIIFIILYITAFILGMFVEWTISRPEPTKTLEKKVRPKVNEKEWKKCMEECGAYYQDNGKIWDNETAVIDVKKSKKKKK